MFISSLRTLFSGISGCVFGSGLTFQAKCESAQSSVCLLEGLVYTELTLIMESIRFCFLFFLFAFFKVW